MKKIISIFCFALVISLIGCVSISKEAPKKRFFAIEADLSKIKKSPTVKFPKLRINKLKINSNYEGKEFIYRKDLDFESDYYNQFLTSPPTNITEQVITWLNESKLSEVITNRISSSDSNLLLEGNINLLYADFSGGKIYSVVEIEFYLSDNIKDQVVFKKLYSKKILSPDKEPVSIIRAWNQGLTEILITLENDLRAITYQ
ncbi:MAG: hypothetical protein IPH52_27740 [Leptospiraceae bacterium]|nr:hypothetical protein [Leptospiraceae bacterium]MBK7058774.1 hypothetical protein [Leptospiraceae bacterium]